jgi:probable phosphoglycerate mutase
VIYLVRHGETEWSLSRRHTGTTDLPLTERGRLAARRLRPILEKEDFVLVLTSPLRRARETCELAGFGDRARIDVDLHEWSYGEYEGLTLQQIRERRPGWQIFRDGCPSGESPAQIGDRVDRVIDLARAAPGNVAMFAHGHVLRVLGVRYIGLPVSTGQHFTLDTATVSVLGYDLDSPAIRGWNYSPSSTRRRFRGGR